MLSLGWQEMVVIFLAALVLFGPKKLPELGRTIGKAITEFRRASNELKSTFDREMQTIERENESLRETTQKYLNDISGETSHSGSSSYSNQSGSYEDSSYYDSSYYDSDAYRPLDEGAPATGDSTTATSSEHVGEPATQGAETATAAADTSGPIVAKPAEGAVARGSSAVAEAAVEKA